ncbi:rod-binding protein [Carboxydocella sp. ULO1]|uniref:rod-binding protein n=1 Tax=Carboxydocella sp. ULO1 TaxID=1926599 RepID=UPI0009ADD5B8|nr:rod-binding protein [Carboxydocella sp. ULO1]GAW29449.1 hypothetical protein ULO1_20190 [Carboxydocella sp. ULO1]
MTVNGIGGPSPLKLAREAVKSTVPGEGQEFARVLEQAAKSADDKKLKEACQQMEALFLHQLLQRMRATVPKGGLFPEDNGEEIFRDMLDGELAVQMSKAGGIGLAEMLYQQLKPHK